MMFWYGDGLNGWGYGLMTVGMVVFWALVIGGIVMLVRYVGGGPAGGEVCVPQQGPTPQRVLADRYARGEIDDEEYARRLKILGSGTPPIATA
ncbi:SHOCT domain-containing protein [Nocardia pneumoniae]|uniref:SHOCT domain-containing protein n=1 Tax=Nocardia pneumoniae TaxID=228601 RepID=UPI000593FC81|nr:SHOCT domain-containing protein [Nocardia pneumoniae]